MLFFIWVGSLFVQSMNYDDVINEKSEEVARLKSVNSYFEEQISDVNDKLKKINEYLNSINGNNHEVKAQEHQFKQPKSFKEEDLPRKEKNTFNQIKNADLQLASIQFIAQDRIKKIENAIALTGLNIKKMPPKSLQKRLLSQIQEVSLNEKNDVSKQQGGPILEDESLDSAVAKSASKEDLVDRLEKVKFNNEIDYLIVLERVAHVMPLSKPMRNYYVSSGFGSRVDPVTGRIASHQGLDFVGVAKEKIISPSEGKVILAGKFSDYGNAIVIDHGFGITTRYGHLSEVKVSQGQMVKKGDVIALQGSTGRSTGAHLHYEVRYKNTPLNPKRFLEAGESLFNDEKGAKYVNS